MDKEQLHNYYIEGCLKSVDFIIEKEDENGFAVRSNLFPNAKATGSTLYEAIDNLKEKIYEVDPKAQIFFS